MSQSDRAFGVLLASALAVGAVLALPLGLTVFPGAIQHSLHASEAVVRTCVAAVYAIGRDLPPLGGVLVALTLGSIIATLVGATRLLKRTARATQRVAVAPPDALRAAAERVGVTSAIRAFEDEAALAYTAGLLRPRIWISTALTAGVAPDELDAVLWHERAHVASYDPLRVLVARVISRFFILVPWISVRATRFEVAKELDADRAAVRAQRGAASLAGALVALGRPSRSANVAIGAWSMAEVRVDQLCGEDPSSLLPRSSRRVRALSVAALSFVLLLTLGQAARANVVPASLMELWGTRADDGMVHECPLPVEGMLF